METIGRLWFVFQIDIGGFQSPNIQQALGPGLG